MSEKKKVVLLFVYTILVIAVFALLQFTTGFFSKFVNWLNLTPNEGFVDLLIAIVLFCLTFVAIAVILPLLVWSPFALFNKLSSGNQQKTITEKSKALFEAGEKKEAILVLKERIKKTARDGRGTFQNSLGWLISILQSYGLDDAYLREFRNRIIWYMEDKYDEMEPYYGTKGTSSKINNLYTIVDQELDKEFEMFISMIDS